MLLESMTAVSDFLPALMLGACLTLLLVGLVWLALLFADRRWNWLSGYKPTEPIQEHTPDFSSLVDVVPREEGLATLEGTAVLLYRQKTNGTPLTSRPPYRTAATQLLAHLQPTRLQEKGYCQLWLRNEGAYPVRCEINLRDPAGELQFNRTRHAVTVDAGQEEIVTIVANGPSRPLVGNSRIYPFEARLTAAGQELPQSLFAQVEVRPWLPTWGAALLVIALFLCMAGAFFAAAFSQEPGDDAAATAVAAIAQTATAQATPILTPTVMLPTPTPTPVLPPASCAQLRATNRTIGDGEQTLYWRNNASVPMTVYCHDMAGNPREYLTLPNSGGAFNYALIAYPEGALTTHYQKIRLDPVALTIDANDDTFATTLEPVPGYTVLSADEAAGYPVLWSEYGRALGCSRNVGSAPLGAANIDLTGTDFALAQTVDFIVSGVGVENPVIDISTDGRTANLQVDGRCGQIYSSGPLQLVWVGNP